MEILKQYTKIYYTGDMANDEGFGHIKKVMITKWGTNYSIKMDDGRSLNTSHIGFEYLGHCGTRFVTEQAYNDYRQEQLKKYFS